MLIARAIKIAGQISAEFERLVSSGRITFDDLFDNNYVPIEGTDPVQYSTRFLPLLEQVLPPIQNPYYDANPNMTLCSAIDRNGYIPVHRPTALAAATPRRAALERTQLPQPAHLRRSDAAHRRRAARGPTPSSSSATRAMAISMLIRSVAAPIRVFGKHWGAIRTTYRI